MNHCEYIDIDCLGDICPVPLMKLKKYEGKIPEGVKIKLVTDHSCVSESVKNYCDLFHYKLEIVEPINGVWELYISS